MYRIKQDIILVEFKGREGFLKFGESPDGTVVLFLKAPADEVEAIMDKFKEHLAMFLRH